MARYEGDPKGRPLLMKHSDTLPAMTASQRGTVTRYRYERQGARFSIIETSSRLWVQTPRDTVWIRKEDQDPLLEKLLQYGWGLARVESVPAGTLFLGNDVPRLHPATFRSFFHPSSIPPPSSSRNAYFLARNLGKVD